VNQPAISVLGYEWQLPLFGCEFTIVANPIGSMYVFFAHVWLFLTGFVCHHEILGNQLGASRVVHFLKLTWFAGKLPADFSMRNTHEFTDGEFFILLSR